MDRQQNTETTAKRRASATRQGIIAAGCVAGALLIGASAEAKTPATPQHGTNAIHSSVLRGQLTGYSYQATKALQPLDGSPVTHHSDYTSHGDTPHNDTGTLWWHTDVGHSDYVNHTDVTTTSTASPSP